MDTQLSLDIDLILRLRTSAKQGCLQSQFYLGLLYHQGIGTEESFERAFYWFRSSAEGGYIPAQERVGDMYRYGEGVKKDLYYATTWYERAAKNGCSHCAAKLTLYKLLLGRATIKRDSSTKYAHPLMSL